MEPKTCENCGKVLIKDFWGVPNLYGCVGCGSIYDKDGTLLYTAQELQAFYED